MRSPTAAFATALAKPHLDDVVFAELQFAAGSSFVCSREHDVVWNGQTWLGRGRVGSIEMVGEGHELEARGIAMSLSGLPGGMLATALNPAEYKNRPAKLWYGLLDPDMIDFDFTQGTLAAQVGAALASIGFTRAGATATRVNEQGLIETVAADTPRFDYDPVTLALKGLLIEEPRENLFLRSREFDNAYWSKTGGAAAEADAATAPSGEDTAERLTGLHTTDSDFGLIRVITISPTTVTASIWVKGEGANIGKRVLAKLKRSGLTTFVTASTQLTLTDTWQRVSVTMTMEPDNVGVIFSLSGAAGGNAGTRADGCLASDAQFEVGAFATSDIPTTTATATRNADVATVSDVSGFYNASEGTLVSEWDLNGRSAQWTPYIIPTAGQHVFGDSSGNLYVKNQADNVQLLVTSGVSVGAVHKLAAFYKAGELYGASFNGAAVVSDSQILSSTATQISLGHESIRQLNGHLRRFTYFPKRLGNAALMRLSGGGDPAAEAVGRRLVADPVGPFLYRMDSLEFELGEQASVRLTAESRLADWDRPRVRRYNDADQQNEYPGDKFFEYAERMVEWQETW